MELILSLRFCNLGNCYSYFLVQKAKDAQVIGLLAGTLGVARYKCVKVTGLTKDAQQKVVAPTKSSALYFCIILFLCVAT